MSHFKIWRKIRNFAIIPFVQSPPSILPHKLFGRRSPTARNHHHYLQELTLWEFVLAPRSLLRLFADFYIRFQARSRDERDVRVLPTIHPEKFLPSKRRRTRNEWHWEIFCRGEVLVRKFSYPASIVRKGVMGRGI